VVKPGTVNADLVTNLDFAETLLEATGTQIPADMQGQSLMPLLRGETPADWRQSLYYHYYEHPAVHMVHRHYGVRTPQYKLMHFYQINEWELYDLARDPHEQRSVYGDPKYAQVQAELERELARLREQYRVPEDTAR
jgi:arylsulfatase A-like enzyme